VEKAMGIDVHAGEAGRTGSGTLAALDRLERLLDKGRRVPHSDDVLVDGEALSAAGAEIEAALTADLGADTAARAGLIARCRELDGVLASATPVSLIHRVRVNRATVYEIGDALRAGLAAELGPPPDLGWPPDDPEAEMDRWLFRPWIALGAIVFAAGVALGLAVDPALYTIAVMGAVTFVGVAVFRLRMR
jgi:hypothetical protein